MKLKDLYTPCVLLDQEQLERNIQSYQDQAAKAKKELWPMIKTHKSSVIARLQKETGAAGFLAGTLRECEALLEAGLGPVIYAYPVAGAENIARALEIGQKGRLMYSLDGEANSRQLSQAWLDRQKVQPELKEVEVMLIIDSGLHRFGIQPELAGSLGSFIRSLPGLKLVGISTHPGHVYSAQGPEDIKEVVSQAEEALRVAWDGLRRKGLELRYVATGSTPSFQEDLKSPLINMVRPGNYVFHDQTQIQLMGVREEECALTVLATVIARPSLDRLLIDAGSKTLALDKGAHTIEALDNYGRILGHPELKLTKLSEEVGKIEVEKGVTTVEVGDQLRIIPNHTCPVTNLVGEIKLVRGDEVIGTIPVDMKNRN